VRDVNIFATSKERIVCVLVALGIGAWLRLREGFPLALCLVVSLAELSATGGACRVV
jgi:hypothetical protein